MRVLLADDDQDIREIATMVFDREGLEVVTVASGREAVAALAADTFALAVLDQQMPPGGGLEAAAERRAAGDTTPMVLWTALPMSLDPADLEILQLTTVAKTDVHGLLSAVRALVKETPPPG